MKAKPSSEKRTSTYTCTRVHVYVRGSARHHTRNLKVPTPIRKQNYEVNKNPKSWTVSSCTLNTTKHACERTLMQ